MKRISLLCLAGFICGSGLVPAQNSTLERTNIEETFALLRSQIRNLEETTTTLLKKCDRLENQLESMRRELQDVKAKTARSGEDYATREELKRYVDQLREIEKKREADNELVQKSIRELSKIRVAPHVEPKTSAETPSPSQDTKPYTIKSGDGSLSAIVNAFNSKFASEGLGSITVSQVQKANPGLDPNKVRVGQKIEIPIPPKK